MAELTGGHWVTINGAHIFIKDGQSPEEALAERANTKTSKTKKTKTASEVVKDYKESGLAQSYDFRKFERDYGYEGVIIDMVTKPIGSEVDLRSRSEKKKNEEGETAKIVDRVTNSGVSKYPQTGDQVILKFRDNSYGRYAYNGLGIFNYVDNKRKISNDSRKASNKAFRDEIASWRNFNGSLHT